MRTGVVWCATTACVSRRASAAGVSCSLTHFGASPRDAPSCPQHRNRCSNACIHDCAPRIKSKFMNRLTQRRARRQPRHAGGGSGEGTASSCRRDKGTKSPFEPRSRPLARFHWSQMVLHSAVRGSCGHVAVGAARHSASILLGQHSTHRSATISAARL